MSGAPSALATTRAVAPPAGFRGAFRTDDDARAVYSESAGVARIIPAAVAVPADADDVVTLVRWASASGTPLIPRGAASSMANGAIGPGVIVDLRRLDALGEVDVRSRRITVGPAVTRAAVEARANAAGLTMPVDPSSGPFATIGGMCATNAAGARTVRYGAMRAWVEALDCVFADGTRALVRRGSHGPDVPPVTRFRAEVAPRLRTLPPDALQHPGVRKESSGYALATWRERQDLVDLLVGSEGTLAIIVGVTLRLAPRPFVTGGLLAAFPDLEGAAAAAVHLAAQGASAVEMLDRTFLEIAASLGDPLPVDLPPDVEAVLIVEVEGISEGEAALRLRDLTGWCEAGGAIHVERAIDERDSERLWALRHAASPILNRLAPTLQSLQVVEDGCVPPPRFAEYVRGVRQALRGARFKGVIFGHAGDGHAHVNALVDVREADWQPRLQLLLDEVTRLIARLGGTVAGEHGDGRLRAPLLPRVWNPRALELFALTKKAFDPQGIFNPGVKVATPGATALGLPLKYDPTQPPLPDAARRALDHIVRHRAWNTDRLALLAQFSE